MRHITLHIRQASAFRHKESQKNSYANSKQVADYQQVMFTLSDAGYLTENQAVTIWV